MKYTLLILAVLLSGCTTTENLSQSGGYDYKGIDFREFTQEGFQFTPEKPTGQYESIGIVEVNFDPEIKEISSERSFEINKGGGITEVNGKMYRAQSATNGGIKKYYIIELFDTNSLLQEIYELASGWGANAVVNLRFEYQSVNRGLTWSRVTVRGFAIKKD